MVKLYFKKSYNIIQIRFNVLIYWNVNKAILLTDDIKIKQSVDCPMDKISDGYL